MSLLLYKYNMNKIKEFKKRNQKRNSHLYKDNLIEDIDYVVCPVSHERLSMIKSSYIERILNMTVQEYDQLYPRKRGVCKKRIQNIKDGLKQIDKDSGLTKYEIGQTKARFKLNQIDAEGKSGYKRKGEKTRKTHMSRIDELGRNGYRRQADARLTTMLDNGLTVEQFAHQKQKESLILNNKSGSGGASKLSKKILLPLINFLKNNNIKFYFDDCEYGIKDIKTGNYYFWDLTMPDLNMAIEYQSSVWHADPTMTENEWKTWKPPKGKQKTAEQVLLYDYNKARSLYKNRGFRTYYIWQKTQEKDIEEIICLLKTQITKF